jgi:hypothetical protein
MNDALTMRLLYVFSLGRLFNFLPLSGMLRLENTQPEFKSGCISQHFVIHVSNQSV